MKRFKLLKVLIIIFFSLTFITIYQHNKIVKMNYIIQRFELEKINISKKRNDLLVQCSILKSYHQIKQWAMNRYSMKVLPLSRTVTLTVGTAYYD